MWLSTHSQGGCWHVKLAFPVCFLISCKCQPVPSMTCVSRWFLSILTMYPLAQSNDSVCLGHMHTARLNICFYSCTSFGVVWMKRLQTFVKAMCGKRPSETTRFGQYTSVLAHSARHRSCQLAPTSVVGV